MQACQIMAQFGIVAFHRIGLGFVEHGLIKRPVIIHIGITRKAVTEIVLRSHRLIDQGLNDFENARPFHCPADDAARRPIYGSENVDFVFFCPMKV